MKNSGAALYDTARGIIPGGTQLLSKRPEMFLPEGWPAYYKKCSGIEVTDLDGKHYLDFTIAGVGACALGYADPDVDAAVSEAVRAGNMCTLNAPEEVQLAEILCDMHPWADMVRYARCGGEAMAVAVRIARAHTGKSRVLFCGYHGWHDWYLSANIAENTALDGQLLPGLEPAGVPRELKDTAVPFAYNDAAGFLKIASKHRASIAAVVMEPVRSVWPRKGFLETVRAFCNKNKIPLIFDEVTSAFRMNTGGIHLKLGVNPDIAVFAKALGNGYPMAAIIGRAAVMNSAQKSFISSTYWTDKIGPVAALAAIKKHKKINGGKIMTRAGKKIQAAWQTMASKYELDIKISGIPPLSHWSLESPQSAEFHTIIAHRMLNRGFLVSRAFYATCAHKDIHIEKYTRTLDGVIKDILPHIKSGKLKDICPGPPIHTGFKRLT